MSNVKRCPSCQVMAGKHWNYCPWCGAVISKQKRSQEELKHGELDKLVPVASGE